MTDFRIVARNALRVTAVIYVGVVALAVLLNVSVTSSLANLVFVVAALFVGWALVVVGVRASIKTMKLRTWLRLLISGLVATALLFLSGIAMIGVAFGTKGPVDYQEVVGNLICRGYIYGGATVRMEHERIEVVVVQPLIGGLERELGSRSSIGYIDTLQFAPTCAGLQSKHGG